MIDHDELVLTSEEPDPELPRPDRGDHRAAPGRRTCERRRLHRSLSAMGRRDLQAPADHARSCQPMAGPSTAIASVGDNRSTEKVLTTANPD